jgi:hypothetical protein
MADLDVEARSGIQFSGSDELIGLVSSWDLSRVGETGYGLVVTGSRVIGARSPDPDDEFMAYLGPGSTATDEDRSRAVATASRLLESAQFVLPRDDIAQILYRQPGLFSGGFVVFKTQLKAFKVEIPVVSGWNEGPLRASRVLIESLKAFSPERLYDGRSGALYVEEVLKRGETTGTPG